MNHLIRGKIFKVLDYYRWPELNEMWSNYEEFKKGREAAFFEVVKNTPYYSNRQVKGNETIKSFFLTKNDLKSNFQNLINPKFTGKHRMNTSGGSTGEPAIFLQEDQYDRYVSLALRYYYEKIIGCDVRPLRKVVVWGSEYDIKNWQFSPNARLKTYISNSRFFNAFNLDCLTISSIVEYLIRYRVEFLRGYASSLRAIADWVRVHRGTSLNIPIVVSSAEKISDGDRDLISQYLGGNLFDIYGSRECGMIAGACAKGNYHNLDFNQAVKLGELVDGFRKIYVSTLNNRVMPLVNYEIGDLTSSDLFFCNCGNPLPAVEKIVGRVSDNFVRSDGSVIHGEYFTHLLYFNKKIKRFQFIQETISRIVLYYEGNVEEAVEQKLTNAEVQILTENIRVAMRADIEFIAINRPIEVGRGGKTIYTVSCVK